MTTQNQLLREAFEAYFLESRKSKGRNRRPTFERFDDGTYKDDHTQRHWWTWQQARTTPPASKPAEGGEVVAEFKRERRYIVFKLTDIRRFLSGNQIADLHHMAEEVDRCRVDAGKTSFECLVVESDWPEYESTWRTIEQRVTGTTPPASQEPCKTCRGVGLIGGFMQDGSCYGEGCPECNPEPPASQEQAKWCEYVAGMVDTWLRMCGTDLFTMEAARREKAIAGIIGRRLWALKREASHEQAQQPSGGAYTVERHGSGWAIYRGRTMMSHGANLGHLTETTPSIAEMIEVALNAASAQQPKPKPMTDEQIMGALKACTPEDCTKEGWIRRTRIKWARAIEAHHGITSDKEAQS